MRQVDFKILVYVETGRATTDQVATFTIGATSTVATWRVKVNQIECHSTSKYYHPYERRLD